jgi:Tfp pilus assembly protein PilF
VASLAAAPVAPTKTEPQAPVATQDAAAARGASLGSVGEAAEDDNPGTADAIDTDSMSIAEIRQSTVDYLNRGKLDQAITLAERLIASEPDHAFGYRCLGSAYQDLGRMKDARDVYDECVKTARVGRVIECSQLGGRVR